MPHSVPSAPSVPRSRGWKVKACRVAASGRQIDRLTQDHERAGGAHLDGDCVKRRWGAYQRTCTKSSCNRLAVQATTVNSLFNDALASLSALGTQWQRFSAEGLATGAIEQQFTRLTARMLDTVDVVLTSAFSEGTFAEFLQVAASIPEAVTALNPAWQALQQMAATFGQVVGPIAQKIMELEDAARTTGERAVFAAQRVADLRSAITDAGTAADQALPLYARLATAIQEQAAAEEAVIRETFQRAAEALNELNEIIETQTSLIADLRAEQDALVQSLESIVAEQDQIVDGFIQQQQAIQSSLEEVIARQDARITDITSQQEAIRRVHEDVNQQLLQDLEQLRERVTGLQTDIQQTLRGQASPVRSAEMIRQALGVQQGIAATQGGAAQVEALQAQKALLDELIALGQSTDQLILIAEAQRGLEALAAQTEAIGVAIGGQMSVAEAERIAAKAQGDAQIVLLDAQLQEAHILRAAAQELVTWMSAQLGQQQLSDAALISTAQASYYTIQAQLNEAMMTRDAAQAQVEWMKAQLGATAETNASIIAGAQSTFLGLAAQIGQAEEARAVALAQLQQMIGSTSIEAAQVELTRHMEEAIQQLRHNTLVQLQGIQDELRALFAAQPLAQQLLHLGDQTAAQTAVLQHSRDIQGASLMFLQHMANQLGGLNTLIGLTEGVIRTLNQPLRTVAAMRGGPIHLAMGGMVPAMLEPGERIYYPPVPAGVPALNRAVPRFGSGGGFTVPGSGSGDTFAAWVPTSSFALNSRASGARGYQGGGSVASGATPGAPIVINIQVHQQPGQNVRELISEITRQLRREFRGSNNQSPFR